MSGSQDAVQAQVPVVGSQALLAMHWPMDGSRAPASLVAARPAANPPGMMAMSARTIRIRGLRPASRVETEWAFIRDSFCKPDSVLLPMFRDSRGGQRPESGQGAFRVCPRAVCYSSRVPGTERRGGPVFVWSLKP